MSDGAAYLGAIFLGIGVFMTLLVIFQERHFMLKYLFIMGILVSGFFIPSAVYEMPNHCLYVLNTSTTINATATGYSYAQQCFTTTSNFPDTFYKVYWWTYMIMILYFIIKMFYDLYQHYVGGKSWKDWQGWFK